MVMRATSRIRAGFSILWLVAWVAWGWGGTGRAAEPGGFADALVFENTTLEIQGKPGETSFTFNFAFTNNAPGPAVIESVRTSCGCTVARVPTLPWTVPPGGRGDFSVVLDGRGKRGVVPKTVFVSTSLGLKTLTVRAVIAEGNPAEPGDDRLRNMQVALADRFAVFRGDCASCHATPAVGKMGAAAYLAACGVCHEAQHRASMVPDLRKLPHPTDHEHWIKWITFGRHGSLMPAFAQSEGGILTDAQVDSIADYLSRTVSGIRLSTTRKPLTGVPVQIQSISGDADSAAPATPPAQPLTPLVR